MRFCHIALQTLHGVSASLLLCMAQQATWAKAAPCEQTPSTVSYTSMLDYSRRSG